MFKRIFNFIKKVFNTIKNAFESRPIPMIGAVVITTIATIVFAPILSFPAFTPCFKDIAYIVIATIASLYTMAIIINGEASV